MDVDLTSDTHRSIQLTSDVRMIKLLTKIEEKATQLKTTGLKLRDQESLRKHRLNLIWGESGGQDEPATAWRKGRARRAYNEIQDLDAHLFLAVVLAITPTECARTSFDNVLEHLLRLENYKSYRLNLNPASKKVFESTAAEQGFAGSRRYLNFMQALFPQCK